MKKSLVYLVLLGLMVSAGYRYGSALLNKNRFIEEVDSLLNSPRDLSEKNLPALIQNKARLFGIDLDPNQILVKIKPAQKGTTTSRLVEGKGLVADTSTLTLRVPYSYPLFGMSIEGLLDRERTFTAGIRVPSVSRPDEDDPFQE